MADHKCPACVSRAGSKHTILDGSVRRVADTDVHAIRQISDESGGAVTAPPLPGGAHCRKACSAATGQRREANAGLQQIIGVRILQNSDHGRFKVSPRLGRAARGSRR